MVRFRELVNPVISGFQSVQLYIDDFVHDFVADVILPFQCIVSAVRLGFFS